MSSTVTYNKRDIQKILRNNGWTFHHYKGSHAIYRNATGRHLTIGTCNCNKMVMQRLIKEYSLKV
jgi:predicted RNA binding protein YcfA (HicA-like mRNA interferase family)